MSKDMKIGGEGWTGQGLKVEHGLRQTVRTEPVAQSDGAKRVEGLAPVLQANADGSQGLSADVQIAWQNMLRATGAKPKNPWVR